MFRFNRTGQANLYLQAALWPRLGPDRPAVSRGDGAHNGQSQAGAAAVVRPCGAEPPERLEQSWQLLGRDDVSGVAHDEGWPGVASDFDLGPAAGLVVLDRVRYQIGHEPFQQQRVAGDEPPG